MDTTDQLQNFVFRAMLLDSTLASYADSGLDIGGNASKDEQNEEDITLDDFPLDLRANAIKMAKTYTTFYCFENSVRKLVSDRLSELKGVGWWESCVPQKIKTNVKSRQEKDKKNRWHSPRGTSEISYCDFGNLCDIIINNWLSFEDLFPAQDWIKTRLNDLEPSRNAIAHNNLLMDHDIKRISMFLRDWILQVG